MTGLQGRGRPDSSSKDENSQQNKLRGKKKKTKKRKKKRKEEKVHQWGKEANAHQAVEFEYRSNPHNRVPQYNRPQRYMSDDSDSNSDRAAGNIPGLCSRYDDNSSIDSEDSEACLITPPPTKDSPHMQGHRNKTSTTTNTTATSSTDSSIDLIPGEIEIRTNGSHTFP